MAVLNILEQESIADFLPRLRAPHLDSVVSISNLVASRFLGLRTLTFDRVG